MGRLLLVRHGESIWNRDEIVQGQDGPGLSPLGHEQARRLADRLLAAAPDAVVVSSDLERCVETAAPYVRRVGRDALLDTALRERHFGRWQGRARDEVASSDPQRWARLMRREDVVGEVGGESTPQLDARVVPALRRLAAAAPVTVVFTHGGPIWHGTHALLGIEEGVLGPPANAGLTVLDVDADLGRRMLAWNQVGHLAPDMRTAWPPPRRD